MTSTKQKWLLATTLVTLGMGGSAVYARTFPAFLGQPQNPTQYTSFVNGGGAVTNVGPGTRQFCLALPVDSSGSKTVSITAIGANTSQNVSCFSQAVNASGFGTGFSGLRSLSVFGSFQTITLPSVSVVSSGALFACCHMDQGATIGIVNYNP